MTERTLRISYLMTTLEMILLVAGLASMEPVFFLRTRIIMWVVNFQESELSISSIEITFSSRSTPILTEVICKKIA